MALIFILLSFYGAIVHAATVQTGSENQKPAILAEIESEIGDDYVIKPHDLLKVDKIWVENKDVLSAELKERGLVVKSLQVGTSFVRIGHELKFFKVYPAGSRHNFLVWSELSRKNFKGLTVSRCGYSLCAYGILEKLSDYLTILKYARQYHAPLTMAVTSKPELQTEIKKYIAGVLREHGQTPQKIIFSDKWRSFYKSLTTTDFLKNELQYLGVELITQDNVTQLADNIEVTVQIVEMNKNFVRKLGISWPTQYQGQIIDLKNLRATPSFEVALNAAENSGEAKVLASPKLSCRSGKEAEFFAGGEFPVKVQTVRSSHLEWKRYGIGLKLKPQVDPLGQLNLQIDTEVSSVDFSLKVDDMPAVQVSRVSTFFDLINNKTISLSGLLRNESSQNAEGLPFLQNLPVIGSLFKSQNFIENKTEMVVFVTPHLINTENE
jgi:pilus assembly protein CpaC